MTPVYRFALLAMPLVLMAGCGRAVLPGTPHTLAPGASSQQELAFEQQQGEVEFSFDYTPPAAQRRLLATVADVKSYKIAVKNASGAIVGFRSVNAPTEAEPKVTVRISDLDPGTYTVEAYAYAGLQVTGQLLGAAKGSVTVVAGECAFVRVPVKLIPTQAAATQGAVQVGIEVVDGDLLPPSPPCTPIPSGFLDLDATPAPSPAPSTPAVAVTAP